MGLLKIFTDWFLINYHMIMIESSLFKHQDVFFKVRNQTNIFFHVNKILKARRWDNG